MDGILSQKGITNEIFAAATMFGVDVYEATDSLGAPRWMVFRPRKASLIREINSINGCVSTRNRLKF